MERRGVVLALPAPQFAGRGRHSADIIMIQAGEDILEEILSHLNHNVPERLKGNVLECSILRVIGSIVKPLLEAAGNVVELPPDEEFFSLISLQGSFSVDREGTAHSRGNAKIMCADSTGRVYGGSVSGQLIAAEPIQVVVLMVRRG